MLLMHYCVGLESKDCLAAFRKRFLYFPVASVHQVV